MVAHWKKRTGMVLVGLFAAAGLAWNAYFPAPWFFNRTYLRLLWFARGLPMVRSADVIQMAEWAGEPDVLSLRVELNDGGKVEMIVPGDTPPAELRSLALERVGEFHTHCMENITLHRGIAYRLDLSLVEHPALDPFKPLGIEDLLSNYDRLHDVLEAWDGPERVRFGGRDVLCYADR
ncbi:MAG: hypothetical protein QM778_18135 [Myxococcales bacterium]